MYMYFFLSGNFLTSTIILLIFIRVQVRENGGKERIKKEKDEVCMRGGERDVVMLNLIKWVSYFPKYLQK